MFKRCLALFATALFINADLVPSLREWSEEEILCGVLKARLGEEMNGEVDYDKLHIGNSVCYKNEIYTVWTVSIAGSNRGSVKIAKPIKYLAITVGKEIVTIDKYENAIKVYTNKRYYKAKDALLKVLSLPLISEATTYIGLLLLR